MTDTIPGPGHRTHAERSPVTRVWASAMVAEDCSWVTRTNSMLLDIRTISLFSLFVVPPLITLVILSFYVGDRGPLPLIVISAVSMLLVGMGYIFKSTIDDRWGSDIFGS